MTRSILQGPAGKHDVSEPIYKETIHALTAVLSTFEAAKEALDMDNVAGAKEAIARLLKDLDVFERSVTDAIGVSADAPELEDQRTRA